MLASYLLAQGAKKFDNRRKPPGLHKLRNVEIPTREEK